MVRGEAVSVILDGFPAGVDVPLAIYAIGALEQWSFCCEAPTVRTDGTGRGGLNMPTAAGDPTGRYCVRVASPDANDTGVVSRIRCPWDKASEFVLR